MSFAKWWLLMCVLVVTPAWAQIPLNSVKVVGSDPAILKFPVSATFDVYGIVPGTQTIRTTGTDRWPAVAIDETGNPVQSGTLWVFLNVNGQWYATGAERLRPNQLNGTKPQGSPTNLIGDGWLYDVNRWGPMAHYNPAPGEHVGLMVVAGSTRSDNQTPVKERTNVIEVLWPGANGANPVTVVWSEGSEPLPDPTPVPTPPPSPPVPPSDDLASIRAKLEQISTQLQGIGDIKIDLIRIEGEVKDIGTSLEAHRTASRSLRDQVFGFLKNSKTIAVVVGILAGKFVIPGS